MQTPSNDDSLNTVSLNVFQILPPLEEIEGEFSTDLETKIAMTHTKHHRDKIYIEKESEELHEVQEKNHELEDIIGEDEREALFVGMMFLLLIT